MSELTNYELCKRIAEIEGFEVKISSVNPSAVYATKDDGDIYLCDYNPLTKKSILFDLMVKHEVFIDYHVSEVIIVNYETQKSFEVDFGGASDIPRSILECIIFANADS